jgi:hypothetical protein
MASCPLKTVFSRNRDETIAAPDETILPFRRKRPETVAR